ncbi:hypothetical protein NW754_007766 [Fusarium falciforme]|uniref:BZIP domain-containing protein n=1 Tax=Fusarium falciforme TaxID=195108 RepID=A0A9W8QS75_9HYPO|nr:hypothetical protein NW754_007766 [Fusarium falciforme]KAJ4177144.1 hypothetical protein NW755_014023 [Fusarium falciforme]KAJ4226467.1 hypothetical protein NW757_014254 [Fusarium falciforme]
MPAFVQSCSTPVGDLTFRSHLDVFATTPYQMISPSSQTSTAFPMSRNNITYKPTPSQIGIFFEEAIDTSPVPIEVGLGSSYIASPTQPAEFKTLGGNEAPQNTLPTVEGDKKLNHRPRNRRRSQAISAPSESSPSGQAAESPKPRKRGRNPKKQAKEQKAAGQQEDLHGDDLIKDPRRRRVLERNRIAATKCRHRKRDEALALASREQAMEDQNRYLSTCFDSLTAEIYYLKTQLLRHTDCNCVLIQKYIANEAKKSVNGLLVCSSAFHTHDSSLSPDYGSSSGASIADSWSMHRPEADSSPPPWTNPFQQGHGASEVRDMFDMGLEPFQTAAMPPDSMVSVLPLARQVQWSGAICQ